MAKFGDGGDLVKCSFCGTSQKQAKKLIAGPGVYICDECIDLCIDAGPGGALPGAGSADGHLCAFCGKIETQVSWVVAGPGVGICNECVALCTEIITFEVGAGPEPTPPTRSSCSFCGKHYDDAERAGMELSADRTAAICGRCIEFFAGRVRTGNI